MNNTLTFDEQITYLALLLLKVDELIDVRVNENGRLIFQPKSFGKMSDIYLQTLFNIIETFLLETCTPPTPEQIKYECIENGISELITAGLIDLLEKTMKKYSSAASVIKKATYIDNLECNLS